MLILKDCLQVAEESTYKNVSVLVCASSKRYGGGYRNHSNAQEEYIFNNTTLPLQDYPKDFYPLDHKDSAGFSVPAQLKSGKTCNFLFVPAPIWTVNPSEEILLKRAKIISKLAQTLETEHLILSAWGCGVFQCPVDKVSTALNTAFKNHRIQQIDMCFLDTNMLEKFNGLFCKE